MMRKEIKKKRLAGLNLVLMLACGLALAFLFFVVHHQHQMTTKTKSTTSTAQTTITSPRPQETEQNQTWSQQKQPIKLPILMYHAIHKMATEEANNANLILAPEVFESHIKRLSEAGYYFLSPEEAYKALSQNSLPAKKVIWLTFDDSLIDFYNVAYPILKKYKAKATNNVITSFTKEGRPGNLSVQQMLEMKKQGMSFQSHTVTHPDLAASSQEVQTRELNQSKNYLDQTLNQKTSVIAYPAGRYSELTLRLANQYQLGITTQEGLASASDGLLSLKRIRILPTTTADDLLSTIAPAVQ